jgi:hypothetical protein
MAIRTEREEQVALHMSLLSPDLVAYVRSRIIAACHTAPRVEGEMYGVLRDLGLEPPKPQEGT